MNSHVNGPSNQLQKVVKPAIYLWIHTWMANPTNSKKWINLQFTCEFIGEWPLQPTSTHPKPSIYLWIHRQTANLKRMSDHFNTSPTINLPVNSQVKCQADNFKWSPQDIINHRFTLGIPENSRMDCISCLIYLKIINRFASEFADQLWIHKRVDRGTTCPDLQQALVSWTSNLPENSQVKCK